METNKKLLANVFLSLVGIVAFSLAVMSRNENVFRDVRGEYIPSSIVLETNKNKIGVGAFSTTTAYSGNGFATTELGNQVAFEYNQLYNPTNYWQTIKAGGYITNTQPITGMTGLTLTKSSVDASIKVSWSSTTTFSVDRQVTFDTSSPLVVTTNFNNYQPNYLKIEAIANSSIVSGKIEFSCSNSYPILSLVSSSTDLGTVSGAGTYAIGEEVTIVATPKTGGQFVGWYDGEVLVSSSASYTFNMPFIDTSYQARFIPNTYTFGTYPQSKVTDSALLTSLNSASGTLPTSANSQAWTSYGYYISSSSATSYMWYIDLLNGSDEYRGVYFTSYRPYYTTNTSSTANSYQDDNGYSTSNVYWFKYQPITWRVLDVQAGKAFLMANLVLDSQDYHCSDSTRAIGGSTVYSNNYKESHIRSWLKDNFYNTAFSTEEKARIQTTTVDNSVASTGYSSNPYACANTSDKVFLLSYAEATSATYGLSTTTSRQLAPSAYAKAQGVNTNTNGFNYWWLRSPDYYNAYSARRVNYDGDVDYSSSVYNASIGVVPALWISL